MNPIKFIQIYGFRVSKYLVNSFPNYLYWCPDDEQLYAKPDERRVLLSDLKRLVESVELVEQFGNELAGAKQLLEFSKDCKTIELSGSVITVERLKQAIADYEAIYSENNMGDDSHIENHISKNCKVIDYD